MKRILNYSHFSIENEFLTRLNENMNSELEGIDKMGDKHQMSNEQDIFNFIFAGRAIFTLQSSRSGIYYTYMMSLPRPKSEEEKKNPKKDLYFVAVLRGPNNTSDYSYMGIVVKRGDSWEFKTTKNSKVKPDSQSCVAFKYFFDRIIRKPAHIDPLLNFFHMNLCARCGRTLTTPESVERGIGPVCYGMGSEEEQINKSREKKLVKMRKDWNREDILDVRKQEKRRKKYGPVVDKYPGFGNRQDDGDISQTGM